MKISYSGKKKFGIIALIIGIAVLGVGFFMYFTESDSWSENLPEKFEFSEGDYIQYMGYHVARRPIETSMGSLPPKLMISDKSGGYYSLTLERTKEITVAGLSFVKEGMYKENFNPFFQDWPGTWRFRKELDSTIKFKFENTQTLAFESGGQKCF